MPRAAGGNEEAAGGGVHVRSGERVASGIQWRRRGITPIVAEAASTRSLLGAL